MVPRHPNGADSDVQTLSVFGREPWSSGYGLLKGCGFKSQSRILDGHFFPLICSINCIVCLKRPKINKKEAGVGPFKKTFSVSQLSAKILKHWSRSPLKSFDNKSIVEPVSQQQQQQLNST